MSYSSSGDTSEQVLYKESPALFRNHPVACVLLCCTGVGIPVVIIWYLRCLMTKLIVTNRKSVLRKGILSKHTIELLHEHVRSVSVSQRLFERILNVGRVDIATASSGVAEISVSGMIAPEKIKGIIQQYQLR